MHAKHFSLPVPDSVDATKKFKDIVQPNFQVGHAYIRHRMYAHEDNRFAGDVEYMMDHQDAEFLSHHPMYGSKGTAPLEEEKFERIIDILEKKTGISLELVDLGTAQSTVAQVFKFLNDSVDTAVVKDVYAHWHKKRSDRYLFKPLLRRFWPVTPMEDTDPHRTFRPREKEKYTLRRKRGDDVGSFEKLSQLKNEFEMMKCLLELVRRREALREIEMQLLFDELDNSVSKITGGERRATTAPLNIPVGPLSDAMWKPLFDAIQKTDSKTTSPVNADNVLKEPSRKKVQKKRPSTVAPETYAPDSKKKKAEDLKPAELPKLPVNPPKLLRPMDDALHYTKQELEISLPAVPFWPALSHHTEKRLHSKSNMYPSSMEEETARARCESRFTTQPVKYRCRGRMGRGGRYIIDRIPVLSAASHKFSPSPQYVGPSIYKSKQHVFLDPAKQRSFYSCALSVDTAAPLTLNATQKTKIHNLYAMEDGEDVDVEIVDFSELAPLRMNPHDSAAMDTAPTDTNRVKKIKEVKFRFVI